LPICGRNFEYLSKEAANNQEYSQHDTDSEVDERTLREIYLPAFEAVVTKLRLHANSPCPTFSASSCRWEPLKPTCRIFKEDAGRSCRTRRISHSPA
jgi:hypothetical protein